MTDYLGNELHIGDKVVIVLGHYLCKEKVTGFTPKMVRTGWGTLVRPSQVVKVNWEDEK